MLFMPLLIAYGIGHSYISLGLSWLPDLFASRGLQRAALLASVVLSGLTGAVVLSYAFAALYGRHAVLLALGVSLFAAAWQYSTTDNISSTPFIAAYWALDFACLIAFLPAAVWMLRRSRPHWFNK